jgi:hypothetical protein
MNSGSLPSSEAGVSYRSPYSSNQQANCYAHGNATYDPSQTAYKHQVVVPQGYPHQNYQQARSHGYTYPSTSSTSVQGESNPYPNVTQNPVPQLQHDQLTPTPPSFLNQAHHHDPHVQIKHQSMDSSIVPAPAAASVSATLAPVQTMFQEILTETRNQVEREAAAHYERVIAEERASAAEHLQKANTQANGARSDAQRFLMLYEASRDQNNKLAAEINELQDEGTKLRRRVGKELEELENRNRGLVKFVQTQVEEMERLKDEWNVGQAVRVKLYAENQRLARELEEAKHKLVKVCWFIFVFLDRGSLSEFCIVDRKFL